MKVQEAPCQRASREAIRADHHVGVRAGCTSLRFPPAECEIISWQSVRKRHMPAVPEFR